MNIDTCFGIIPVQKINHQWHMFIVQTKSGYWGFPKGHPEPNEQPQDTAERELKEETGLLITNYLPIEPISEQYISQKTNNSKVVTYFFAHVHGSVSLCPQEINAGFWATLEQVRTKIGDTKKELLDQIEQLLINQDTVASKHSS